jgi:hypothetical protein
MDMDVSVLDAAGVNGGRTLRFRTSIKDGTDSPPKVELAPPKPAKWR